MSQNDERVKILRVQQFVLNNKSEKIRESLYDYMVMDAIFEHGNNNRIMNKNDIAKSITLDYDFELIHSSIIDASIKRLETKGKLTDKNGIVELSESTKNEINKDNNDVLIFYNEIKQALEKQIVEKVVLSKNKAEEIVKEFFKILGKSFSSCGRISSRLMVTEKKFDGVFGNVDFKNDYREIILKKIDLVKQSLLDSVFLDFFSGNNEKYNQFFLTLAQSYALVEVLNVDPELKELQEKALSEKKIYFDTNFIIDLLFEENVHHSTIKSVIGITKDLGAQMFITNLTKREFERWLDTCKTSYANFRTIPKKFVDAFNKKNTTAPFFNTYHKRLRTNPNLSIKIFCEHYENFLVILENEYSIKVESADIEALTENPKYESLLSLLIPGRGPVVGKHDALCLLYIKQLREITHGNILGPSSWFITTDTSLRRIEKRIFPDEEFPSSILYGVWLQVLSPLLTPTLKNKNNVNKAFTKFLGTNFVSSDAITEEDILNILSAFIDDNDIAMETLEQIIGNTHIRETFRKIRKAHQEDNKDEEIKWKEIGLSQVTKTLEKKHSKETFDMKKALENLTKNLDETKNMLSEQSETIKKQYNVLTEQSKEISSLTKDKIEKNWKLQFLKYLIVSVLVSVGLYLIMTLVLLINDTGSVLGLIGIEATVIVGVFVTWFAVHASRK